MDLVGRPTQMLRRAALPEGNIDDMPSVEQVRRGRRGGQAVAVGNQ